MPEETKHSSKSSRKKKEKVKEQSEDEVLAWVNKSRLLEQKRREEELAKAAKMAKLLDEQVD